MLINEEELNRRLNNPLNLINSMKNGVNGKKNSALSIFIKPSVEEENTFKSPFQQKDADSQSSVALIPTAVTPAESINSRNDQSPSTDDLIDDADGAIKLAQVHNNSLEVMGLAVGRLKDNINNVNVKQLPSIVSGLSKVVTDIRKERSERDRERTNETVHYHFYCPEQKKIEQFEVIDVG